MVKIGQRNPDKKHKKKERTHNAILKDKLDAMFSRQMRDRADNKCEFCGKSTGQMHCHHGVVHRRYMNTRYEPDNCACVCVGCHTYLADFPKINVEFFKKRIGSDRYEQLENFARSGNKVSLDEVKKELEGKIDGKY